MLVTLACCLGTPQSLHRDAKMYTCRTCTTQPITAYMQCALIESIQHALSMCEADRRYIHEPTTTTQLHVTPHQPQTCSPSPHTYYIQLHTHMHTCLISFYDRLDLKLDYPLPTETSSCEYHCTAAKTAECSSTREMMPS